MKRTLDRLRVPLWLCGVAALTLWTWHVVKDVLGSNLLAIPAALAFAGLALLAGPPYKDPPNRWETRRHRVPREVRKKMRFLGRITLWRKEKVELPGKRFAFFRWLALVGAVLTFCGACGLAFDQCRGVGHAQAGEAMPHGADHFRTADAEQAVVVHQGGQVA